MRELIDRILDVVAAHPHYAYMAVFLAALVEAVPVFGSLIPGSTLILALGALATSGHLDLAAMVACAAAGAVIGDGTAYFAGLGAREAILERWPLSVRPDLIARSKEFFLGHGMLAVFSARFIAPIRAFVPVTAGALAMAPHRFFGANIAAACVWAPLHVLPGAIAGTELHRIEGMRPHWFAAAAIVIVALLVWTAWHHWHGRKMA